MGLLYVAFTVLCTVIGQLIIKWQMSYIGALPIGISPKILVILKLMTNFWILGALFLAYLASLSWMIAMTKLPLSYAYPFTSLSILLVFIAGALFFKEPVQLLQIIGVSLIILGICFLGYSK
ncbi:MAG: rane protein [Gammaproteobacteria bacterium]|jgi:multidrug transporter EmrE-like cation transporter|nr:rane protein [Gammaproteobacteria bacterium]